MTQKKSDHPYKEYITGSHPMRDPFAPCTCSQHLDIAAKDAEIARLRAALADRDALLAVCRLHVKADAATPRPTLPGLTRALYQLLARIDAALEEQR